MSPLAPVEGAAMRRELVRWYRQHRRDLPWRRTRDPYAIWVSEAMLQQTRVEAVLEHYRRFLERFPDVHALAAAGEDQVTAAWSGLGYYRRAHSLQRAARMIVERHGGVFPSSREELMALPGIGPYTAGALLSIAFGQPAALVDGNIARVFARLFGIEEPVERSATQRRLWDLAEELVPETDGAACPDDEPTPGEWSQALMELGALLCTPKSPSCSICPLAERCVGRAAGSPEHLPRRVPKRPTLAVTLEALFFERDNRVLLVRRPAKGRMAGMWELPTRELPGSCAPALWPIAFPVPPAGGSLRARGKVLFELSHAITHHRISMRVRRGSSRPKESIDGVEFAGGWCWCGTEEREQLALTGMTRKVLERTASAHSQA